MFQTVKCSPYKDESLSFDLFSIHIKKQINGQTGCIYVPVQSGSSRFNKCPVRVFLVNLVQTRFTKEEEHQLRVKDSISNHKTET